MKEKVLIVEDEKELAKILAAYLEVEGFEVSTALDGESGWEAFVSEGPGLALLDIMLPKQNGIELCRKIREISDIPVIMVSAKSGEMDKVIALGSGADDYVTKPFSPLELVARVKANLRRYHQAAPEAPDGQRKLKKGLLSMNYGSYTPPKSLKYFFSWRSIRNRSFPKNRSIRMSGDMSPWGMITVLRYISTGSGKS